MGKLAEAYVDIGANTKPLESGLARAKGQLSSFAGMAGKLAGGIAIGGLAGAGAGLLSAARKASDLAESVSKVETTFGSAAKSITGNTDRLAKEFGVVKRESLDAAAAFGLMGQAAGLTKAQSAGLASEMVQLGLDIASFHNLSNAEAFEKLRSGLTGEAEPLRPLGILLSDDAMKAEALATGLIKVKRELSEQEKVLARMSLIKRQAGPAVGDLARTKDSTANQMKKLQGELENAAVAFGEGLQGALSDAIKLAHELGAAITAATGKDVATNLGEATRAVINAGRADLAAGERTPAQEAERRRLQHLNAGVWVDRQFGLPVSDARQQELDQLKRNEEGRAAAVAGLALGAGPSTPAERAAALARSGIGRAAAAATANQNAGINQARAAAKEKQDRILQGQVIAHAMGQATLGGVGHFATVMPGTNRLLARQGIVGQGDNVGPRVAGQVGAELQKQQEARDDKAKELEAKKKALVEQLDEHDRRPFQSEQHGGSSEFASSAIQKALSGEDDLQKKQVDELVEVNKKLAELKGATEAVNASLQNRRDGAIVRGRA